ncbi:hypothetical protein BJY01DRAFT_83789 [Aspergillus pseudoustus]|uniref:RapZ C-terminal domain-containing protein n=1 Tax=Aspergillus pseudoustus TaxID=1810923 RepID=A0ABR4J3H7_9EURO
MTSPPAREARAVRISLLSYGHANGPVVAQQQDRKEETRYRKTLAYSIRHLPNPPRHIRAKATGLSRRLQKEFLQNDAVEGFLVMVEGQILTTVQEGCDQLLLDSAGQDENGQGGEKVDMQANVGAHTGESEDALEDSADIDIMVTICCEEGRHRSVAFVEELARRVATFKGRDGLPQGCQLDIHRSHRDIGDVEDCKQSPGHNKGPHKAQGKTWQREHRKKGNKFKSRLGDDGDDDIFPVE